MQNGFAILDACVASVGDNSSSKPGSDSISSANWIVEAALNTHGTRSVQSLVRRCTRDPARQRLISMLSPAVEAMSISTNGNHVIQRCLQIMSPHDLTFVYESITSRLLSISTQRHGCCVVQISMPHLVKHERLYSPRQLPSLNLCRTSMATMSCNTALIAQGTNF